eukprot:TRINITY_DN6748_c0_g1_i11.p4 TRINITY_DN6748_c0_g1~~TRINITY_DN6748_c0_g1_i11.p4  ORF type:complete len:201 (+),score=-7.05 TRINITY_DN6748_c0_g1_i11:3607-4209(+)
MHIQVHMHAYQGCGNSGLVLLLQPRQLFEQQQNIGQLNSNSEFSSKTCLSLFDVVVIEYKFVDVWIEHIIAFLLQYECNVFEVLVYCVQLFRESPPHFELTLRIYKPLDFFLQSLYSIRLFESEVVLIVERQLQNIVVPFLSIFWFCFDICSWYFLCSRINFHLFISNIFRNTNVSFFQLVLTFRTENLSQFLPCQNKYV